MKPEYRLSQQEDKLYAVARCLFSGWLSEHRDFLILWRSCDTMLNIISGLEVTLHGEIIEPGLLGPMCYPFKLSAKVRDISVIESLNNILYQGCD